MLSKKYEHSKVSGDQPEKFQHKKSLGQNFLTSDVVPKWLCAAGNVSATDTVLEIGPGTGALTAELLKTGAKVVAIEADLRAVEILQEKFSLEITSKQLELHHFDARELKVGNFGLKNLSFKVVANIPYYLSGFLLRNLLETDNQPNTLVFLMQKEVVERIARAEKESILSLSIKAFGVPKYVKTVTRGHFNPSPKVDSAILQISNINLTNFSNKAELATFFNILHLGFGQKRKQLLSNLSKIYARDIISDIFTELNIKLDARAETLSLPIWLSLTKKIVFIPSKIIALSPD